MFGWKRKAKAAVVALNKMEHAPLAKAIVAGGVLVAAADGNIADEELTVLRNVISKNPTLAPFIPEAADWTNQYCDLIESAGRSGKLDVKRVLEAIRSDREACQTVMAAVLDIADQGGIDAAEQKVLEEIASILGVNINDF